MYNYDTLDYLIPPVKSRYKNITSDFPRHLCRESGVENDTVRSRPKNLSSKLAKRIREASLGLKTDVRTSSSLVLKTITNKLLLEQFSILNSSKKKNQFTTKVNNKKNSRNNPIIKITVVPISAETQTSKTFFEHKRILKKVQETVSNTDNCMTQNDLCLIRNHQEIHYIRETNSADFLKSRNINNTKHDECLSHITYTKGILNSLNMENKSKKGNLRNRVINEQVSPKSVRKNNIIDRGCTCDDTINTVLNDMNSRKNRVTIIGRLGIDNNEKYILNCAATVNDKTIETQFKQKSVAVPTADRSEDNNRNIKSTKATQANISMGLEKDTTNSETIQCNCNNFVDVGTTTSFFEIDKSKERKDPLIVISVYPTKDKMEGVRCLDDLIQIKQIVTSENVQPRDRNNIIKTQPNRAKIETTNVNTSTTKSIRSRSPSPARKIITKDKSDNRLTDRKLHKTNDKESTNSKLTFNRKNPQKDKSNRNQIVLNTPRTSKVDPFNICQEKTTTDRRKIKKAIVDNYTRKFLSPKIAKDVIKRSGHKPKNGASEVTIDIDGDNEEYRVLFLQDKLNTDLSVKRSLKPHAKISPDLKNKEHYDSGESVDNFLMLSRKEKSGKQKITKHKLRDERLNNAEALDKNASRLKIRDSLEINIRREDGNSLQKTSVQPANKIILTAKKTGVDDNNIFVKHYRGDKCCVPNPAERDQEIRELLGIESLRAEKITQDIFPDFIDHALQRDVYPEKCEESNSSVSHKCNWPVNDAGDKKKITEKPKLVSVSTQYDRNTVYSYQRMGVNRNIQVFLQVDQFTKHKPIILSRQQYDKFKKTIQKKISNKSNQERRKRNSKKCSVISIGEVRKTRKQQISNEKINKIVQAKHQLPNEEHLDKGRDEKENKPLLLLYSIEKDKNGEEHVRASPRQAVSSMEVRYGSMAHMKHVTFSSSNLGSHTPESLPYSPRKKSCHSIHTIFKGHKKSPTPNLGTSAFSLSSYGDVNRSVNKYALYPQDEKPKKPFFRRLMSCLVMRTDKISEGMLPPVRRYEPSVMSSFDSYHISTSLAAIDITSSLYDTSASFYSNHTIYPVARMKRGFLSSVRGFLTNLKGR